MRNCSFEPSLDGRGFEKTLSEIQNAFFWNKPAIISTHRINVIGSLNEGNQIKNLEQFKLLLAAILNKWPEVVFLTTAELGDIIRDNQN